MKDINFEEIREQVRANLAKLVNKRDELCTRHAAMIKDLNTVRDICRTYGSPTDQSEVYVQIFNRVMETEHEIDCVWKDITYHKTLINDIDSVAERYQVLMVSEELRSGSKLMEELVGLGLGEWWCLYGTK
mgnify:FL=1